MVWVVEPRSKPKAWEAPVWEKPIGRRRGGAPLERKQTILGVDLRLGKEGWKPKRGGLGTREAARPEPLLEKKTIVRAILYTGITRVLQHNTGL